MSARRDGTGTTESRAAGGFLRRGREISQAGRLHRLQLLSTPLEEEVT